MAMSRLSRLLKIVTVAYQFGLDQYLAQKGYLPLPITAFSFRRCFEEPLPVRLRLTFESLGPIFVKFGQMISTRRDLISDDLAIELSKLQDQVPPFDRLKVNQIIKEAYGKEVNQVFNSFDDQAVASASIAQVHKATLDNGETVAVKILRPGLTKMINKDIALLSTMVRLIEWFWPEGRRMRLREIVQEFARLLKNEQNFLREAGNASLLGRNFSDHQELIVPEVHWDLCRSNILVMTWMEGLPITSAEKLTHAGVDVPQLAELGVKIFFKQIFRDGFFHADMHPGNILVTLDGRYIALDFGIMGTLSDENRRYLAENLLGFFRRDYRRIATAHIEAGWVSSHTSVDDLEGAIRTVCEQIFDRPLSQISFGHFLIQLFEISKEFEMEIQPQLVLLQKTLLQIEGLGRQLDPSLDLWKTAKPYLENWMSEQMGWRSMVDSLKHEVPYWGRILPQLPRLLQETLKKQAHLPLKNNSHDSTHCYRTYRWMPMVLSTLSVLLTLGILVILLIQSHFFY